MGETLQERAARYVREGEAHVARQRMLVVELQRDGHRCSAMLGQRTLATFEGALASLRLYARHLSIYQRMISEGGAPSEKKGYAQTS